MRKQSKNTKRARAGFTLAETLIAILLLLMATAIVAGGIPVAQRAYYDVVDTANAEVLFSTTITALQDELGSTQGFALNDDNSLNYYRSASQQHRKAELKNDLTNNDEKIVETDPEGTITEIDNPGMGITIFYPDNAVQRKLVSVATTARQYSKQTLYTEFKSIIFENGVFKVTGLKVIRAKDNATLAGSESNVIVIRPMNPVDPTA